MNNSGNTARYSLISGTFGPEEAGDLLMELLEHKISFHRRKIWSHSERFGQNDPASEQRIKELRRTKAALSELVQQAARSQARLTISADIDITLTQG